MTMYPCKKHSAFYYRTATPGDVVTFDAPAALPILDGTFDITATQSGTGDPSPSNVRPITGYTAMNIHVADDQDPHVIDNVTTVSWTSAGAVYFGYLLVKPDGSGELWKTVQDFSFTSASYYGTFGQYNANLYYVEVPAEYQSLIKVVARSTEAGVLISNYFKRNSDEFVATMNNNEIRTNDNTPVTRFYFRWDSAADVTAINTAFASVPLRVVISLKTPTKVTDLTGIEVETIIGENNIYTDTGAVEALRYRIK